MENGQFYYMQQLKIFNAIFTINLSSFASKQLLT